MNGSELDLQTEPIYTWMQHFWNHFYHPGTASWAMLIWKAKPSIVQSPAIPVQPGYSKEFQFIRTKQLQRLILLQQLRSKLLQHQWNTK